MQTTLIDNLVRLAMALFLLRVWMQLVGVDYYNPVTQRIVALLRPLVDTLGQVIPNIGRFNTAAALLAYAIAFGLFAYIFPPAAPYQWLIAALALELSVAFSMVFWVLLAWVISSWVVSPDNPWARLGYQLLQPIMQPIQRVIPSVGGLDFSPIAVFFIVQLLRNLVETRLFLLSGLFPL